MKCQMKLSTWLCEFRAGEWRPWHMVFGEDLVWIMGCVPRHYRAFSLPGRSTNGRTLSELHSNIHLNFKFSKKAILLRRKPCRTGTGLAGEAMGGLPSE